MDFTGTGSLRQLAIDANAGSLRTYPTAILTLDFAGSLRRMTMREAVIEYWDGDNHSPQSTTSAIPPG